MRPQNPFEALINQFLSIPQTVSQGLVRRDEQMRQDRLIEEERVRTDAIRQEQRDQQLTDMARQERLRRIGQIQEGLPFAAPGSELSERAIAAIEYLSRPTDAIGQAAMDEVLEGTFLFPRTIEGIQERSPDGEVVQTTEDRTIQESGDVNALIAELGQNRRDIEQRERYIDIIYAEAADYLSNVEIDPAKRAHFLNNAVLPSELFTDEMKQALAVTAGMRDEDARRLVQQNLKAGENQLTLQEIQIGTARTMQTREELGLRQDQRLADLEVEEYRARVQNLIRQGNLADTEAFLKYGVLPDDAERAEALANRLGISVEELGEQGQERYQRLLKREEIELALAEQSKKLGTIQIDQAELAYQVANYNFERLKGFGQIRDATELATTAFAAAANGDLATIEMLEGLAETMDSAELAQLDFEFLKEQARLAIGDEEAAREFTREQNAALLAQYRRGALIDGATFTNAVAGRMVFLPPEVVESEVDRFIRTLSTEDLEAFGGAEAFKQSLMAEVRFQRNEMDREVGGLTVDLLSKAVPSPNDDGTRSEEQEEWKSDFIVAAVEAGLKGDQADSIAEGLLSGADLEYWNAMLRNRQLELQARELEDKLNDEGVDLDQIKVLLSMEQDRSLNANKMLTSDKCAVSNPAGGETYNVNDPDCRRAFAILQEAETMITTYRNMLLPTELRADIVARGEAARENAITESFRTLWTNIGATGNRDEIVAARQQALGNEDIAGNEERMEILNTILPMPDPVAGSGLGDATRGLAEGASNVGPAINQFFNRTFNNQPTDADLQEMMGTDAWGAAVGGFASGGEHDMAAINRISSLTGLNVGLIRNGVENFVRSTDFQ